MCIRMEYMKKKYTLRRHLHLSLSCAGGRISGTRWRASALATSQDAIAKGVGIPHQRVVNEPSLPPERFYARSGQLLSRDFWVGTCIGEGRSPPGLVSSCCPLCLYVRFLGLHPTTQAYRIISGAAVIDFAG